MICIWYIYIYTVAVLAAKIPSNMCNIGFEKRDMTQKRPIFEGRPCSLVSINNQDPVASHVRSHSVKLQVVEFAVWKGKHRAAVVRTEAFFDDSSATDRYGSVPWLPVQYQHTGLACQTNHLPSGYDQQFANWKDPPIFKFGKAFISIRAMYSMANCWS